jgi:CheY-like chemotaxis protein
MQPQVIVCEDEKFIRWALAEHLRTSGYTVKEAENGLECLKLVEEVKPDIILLDLRMPKMDGTTTLKKLREMGIKTPVFILSGFGGTNSIAEANELGAQGFIAKPYHLSEISQLLEATIQN